MWGKPQPVKIIAYGPDFEGRDDEQGHIEIDIGMDSYTVRHARTSRRLCLMHELPKQLSLRKRLLWAESGEDVSELLARSVQ